MKICFCSFADLRLENSLLRIESEAKVFGEFDVISCYNEFSLDKSFKDEVKDLLLPTCRGFGYWIWKPQVILQSLRMMDKGDVLLYADAGCVLNNLGKKKFNEYINILMNSNSGFLVFGSKLKERQYTKSDLFEYFSVLDKPEITCSGQIQATTFMLRKDEFTESVVNQWLDIMLKNHQLIDDTKSKLENSFDFVEHRHDQSVFSILMKLNSAKVLPMYHIWSYTWIMVKYPIWGKRDKGKNIKCKVSIRNVLFDLKAYVKGLLNLENENISAIIKR